MPCIPGGRFSAVLLQVGGLVLFVPAAGAGRRIGPRHPIEAATEAVTECASPPLGLAPVEPVVYLLWTDGIPVMYPPYTLADDAPDHEARDIRSLLLWARCRAGLA